MFFVNGFIYASWVARLPRIQELYGLDNGDTGLILLVASVGALLAMPFTGWLIVRTGSDRVTALAALLFLVWVALIPLAPGVVVLGLVFFGMGASTGILDVAMNAQAVLVEQAYRRPIMASFHAVFSAGMMLGAGSGALFTQFDMALMPHLLIVTGLTFLLAVWGGRKLLPDPLREPDREGGAFRLPNRALVGVGLIAFCCMLGEGAMADWSTNYLERTAGAGKAVAPLGLAAFSLAMTTGRLFGDRGRARWGDRRILVYSSALALVGMSVALVWVQPLIIIAGFFVVGLGLATIVPIAYSTAGNTPGIAPGVGISMVTTVGYSGFLFGPPIIGFLADWQTLHLALGFVWILFLVMMVLTPAFGGTQPGR